MLLPDSYIDIIDARLREGGIKDDKLHADLLDHICTYIEEHEGDQGFEELLQQALRAVAPGGVHEIEEERYFLFHFQKQITMKRILFFGGFATTFLISMGIMFKLMHWPGASIMLVWGNASLIFTMVLVAANAFKNIKVHSAAFRLRIFAGVVSAILIGTGSIFKAHHWPGASIMFVLGMVILNFIFLPMFFYHLYRQSIAKA